MIFSMVNVLKFRTLYSTFFVLNFALYTVVSGAVWSGIKLFAYAILSETWMYEILGHLQKLKKDTLSILFI